MDKLKLIAHWIVTFPAAILIAWIAFIIINLSGSLVFSWLGLGLDDLIPLAYLHSVPYLIMGGALIMAASLIAPSHSFIVAIICAALSVLHILIPLGMVVFLFESEYIDTWKVVGSLFEIAGVVLGVFSVHSDIKDE
jgi:hypothetical protein|tara:strand:- start:684 stop:1094 length:411 start_codon:yes stop_codon:yes gene_type:complete